MRITTAAFLALAFMLQPVSAQETEPDTEAGSWEACAGLSILPGEANIALKAFEPLFGKPAIEWKPADYKQVTDLAFACDGAVLENGMVISAAMWKNQMDDAMTDVYPIAGVHQEIMRRANQLATRDIELPGCEELTRYKRDPRQVRDNSGEIFGVPLYGMRDQDLAYAVEHMNNCMAFIPKFGIRAFRNQTSEMERAIYEMMDRALMIRQWREEWKTWPDKRENDLLIDVDGYKIPPTFADHETKSLVRRYNRAMATPNGLTLDAVYVLVSIADGILERNISEIDNMFAEIVKNDVSASIFERTGISEK